jgi:hypothetical protein
MSRMSIAMSRYRILLRGRCFYDWPGLSSTGVVYKFVKANLLGRTLLATSLAVY